jgi:molybdopterin-binding protein
MVDAILPGSPAIAATRRSLLVGQRFPVKEVIMKLSARNQLKGTVVEVRKGATTSHVRIDTGAGIITASITNEAVDELGLAPGKQAIAVIKASDVMVGVE